MREKVFVSIGSNLDADKNIDLVKKHLDKDFKVEYSSIYKSHAEGFSGKDFLNLVCSFETDMDPMDLRNHLKEIEKKLGRSDSQKGMSDRVIDLDLILYGDLIIKNEILDIPSSDISNYLFVLEPLCEIAGNNSHPESKEKFNKILEQKES